MKRSPKSPSHKDPFFFSSSSSSQLNPDLNPLKVPVLPLLRQRRESKAKIKKKKNNKSESYGYYKSKV